MKYFRNFFIPLSLETLNNSKSLEPTNAPENELESGDINSETIITQTPIKTKNITRVNIRLILLFF
ncbi:hypothetical protein VY93_02460 [Mycoplasmopsis synoviae ATCC 25204]|nr:hypothetical protein VY93_02460 [Mycoplasmopsis synoviae ATCC 25204]